jgi:hypothetical protein
MLGSAIGNIKTNSLDPDVDKKHKQTTQRIPGPDRVYAVFVFEHTYNLVSNILIMQLNGKMTTLFF